MYMHPEIQELLDIEGEEELFMAILNKEHFWRFTCELIPVIRELVSLVEYERRRRVETIGELMNMIPDRWKPEPLPWPDDGVLEAGKTYRVPGGLISQPHPPRNGR